MRFSFLHEVREIKCVKRENETRVGAERKMLLRCQQKHSFMDAAIICVCVFLQWMLFALPVHGDELKSSTILLVCMCIYMCKRFSEMH